jgi:hypothetical protein
MTSAQLDSDRPYWAIHKETAHKFDCFEDLCRFISSLSPIVPITLPLYFGYLPPPTCGADGSITFDPARLTWVLKINTGDK